MAADPDFSMSEVSLGYTITRETGDAAAPPEAQNLAGNIGFDIWAWQARRYRKAGFTIVRPSWRYWLMPVAIKPIKDYLASAREVYCANLITSVFEDK